MGPQGPFIVWDPTPGTAPVPLRVALTFPRVSTQTHQARVQVCDAAARAGATDRGLRTLEDCPLRLRNQGAWGGRRWARSDRSRPRCQTEMSGPERQGGPQARGVHSRHAHGAGGGALQVRPWFYPVRPGAFLVAPPIRKNRYMHTRALTLRTNTSKGGRKGRLHMVVEFVG